MTLRLLLVALLSVLTGWNCFSQNPNITARLAITAGARAEFVFNSIDKYKSGVTYNEYTKISVYYRDDSAVPDPTTRWELRALSDAAQFDGDHGNSLPLTTLRILPVDGGGAVPLGAYLEPENSLPVPPAELTLVEGPAMIPPGAPQGDFNDLRVNLTYKIGTIVPLLGKSPERYTLNMTLTLIERGF